MLGEQARGYRICEDEQDELDRSFQCSTKRFRKQTFGSRISPRLGFDRHRAYQALRAVLHCLRDRLTMD